MSANDYRTALIASSWRAGSTALNLSLIRHPSIYGWPHELGFFRGVAPFADRLDGVQPGSSCRVIRELFRKYCCISGWNGEPWVVHKDPQDSPCICATVALSGANRVIMLVRNPYAIIHSLLEHFFSTPREAAFHVRDYYDHLLRFESDFPELVYRVRYEDLAMVPAATLERILAEVFGLPMSEECLDLSGAFIPRATGDHKVTRTVRWRAQSVDLWRVGLSLAEKEYVRATCDTLCSRLGYNPDFTTVSDRA